jgi:hypothetical protein
MQYKQLMKISYMVQAGLDQWLSWLYTQHKSTKGIK